MYSFFFYQLTLCRHILTLINYLILRYNGNDSIEIEIFNYLLLTLADMKVMHLI